LLPPNWNHLGARPVDLEALRAALTLLREAAEPGTPAPDLIPTVSGGVQLEWHRDAMDIEVEVVSRGHVEVYWLDRTTGQELEESLWPFSRYELKKALGLLTERHTQPT
jgi:hypothetical protein